MRRVVFLVALTLWCLTWRLCVPWAAQRCVSTSGSDTGNDCTSVSAPCATVRHAIVETGDGDFIRVAHGTYVETVVIYDSTQDLTIQGGWSGDFSGRVEDSSKTVLDGNGADEYRQSNVVGVFLLLLNQPEVDTGLNDGRAEPV